MNRTASPYERHVNRTLVEAVDLQPRALLGEVILLLPVRTADRAVLVDEGVGRHVQRAGDAEEPVEAEVQRATGDRGRVVDVAAEVGLHIVVQDGIRSERVAYRAVGVPPAQSEVPLAEGAGGVTHRLERARQSDPGRLDQCRAVAHQDEVLQRATPRVPAGHQRVPAGGADRGGRVAIGRPHPLGGQPIDVRGRNGRAVATQVAPAHVVGEDQDHVRPAGRGSIGARTVAR